MHYRLQPFPGRSAVQPLDYNGNPRFESADRREAGGEMCEPCLRAAHDICESEGCPCVCNDSDLRFARNRLTAMGERPVDWDLVMALTK